MKKANEAKGITLVALVLTIVILLILAGITINLAFNDNGISNKAQEAKGAWENAEKSEQNELNEFLDDFDNLVNAQPGDTTP